MKNHTTQSGRFHVPKWTRGKLGAEKTGLVGLALLTAGLYGWVLFSHYKAFEARTLVGL